MNYTINDARDILKQHFGYENFRAGQEDIISYILEGRDCLGIMPTGAGKSICYQVPAMLFDGVTIVVSPLISLMKDQVDSLNQVGIPATFVNSTLSNFEYGQTINNILYNVYKIIYVAPERLVDESFFNLLKQINISMFAIDEAHCVSRWGHDFRPSYREIANVILNLQHRPIVAAFTATATELVKDDIINLLHLQEPFCLTTGFDRPNLYFSVQTPDNRKDYIYNYVKENSDKPGIIYCLTRKTVDNIYDSLLSHGFNVSKYHAGMTEKQRTEHQEDFVYDRTNIMVATNAFGMGIDKSNIRYIIHYNMPRDIESYYQEAGRSGRDGDIANCILLFNRSDIITNKLLIEQGNPEVNHSNEYNKLNDMVDYCNTDKCLRKYLLEYFGEVPDFKECKNCSNCNSEVEVTDITTDSQKILSCIKRMHQRFGMGLVTDVLKGSNSTKIKSLGFDRLSTHGIMKDYSKDTIKNLISFLTAEGYIKSEGDKYPILRLDSSSNDVLFNNKPVFIKRKIEKLSKPEKETVIKKDKTSLPYDNDLFNILKQLRMKIANELRMPPFIIFTDVSLKQMSTFYPTTVDKMLEIDGVGTHKMEKYGSAFLEAIISYVSDKHIDIDTHLDKINSLINENANTNFIDNATTPISLQKVNDIANSEKSESLDNLKKKDSSKVKKEDTRMITYNLYKEGKTPQEIANIRGLTVITIENHLLYCFEHDMDIDLENLVDSKYEQQIYDAIEKLGTEKLKPIKEALPEEVSYFDIKYYILKIQKQRD